MERGGGRTLPLDVIALVIEEVARTRLAPEAGDSLFDALRVPHPTSTTLRNLCLVSKGTLPFARAGLVRCLKLGSNERTPQLLVSSASYRPRLRDVEALEVDISPSTNQALDVGLANLLPKLERLAALSLPSADQLAAFPRFLDAVTTIGTIQHLYLGLDVDDSEDEGSNLLRVDARLPGCFLPFLRVLELRNYDITNIVLSLLQGAAPHLRKLSCLGACHLDRRSVFKGRPSAAQDRLPLTHLLLDSSDWEFWNYTPGSLAAYCAQSLVSLTVRGRGADGFMCEAISLELPELEHLTCIHDLDDVDLDPEDALRIRESQITIYRYVEQLSAPKLRCLDIALEPATYFELLVHLKNGHFSALRSIMVAYRGDEWAPHTGHNVVMRDLLQPHGVELHW